MDRAYTGGTHLAANSHPTHRLTEVYVTGSKGHTAGTLSHAKIAHSLGQGLPHRSSRSVCSETDATCGTNPSLVPEYPSLRRPYSAPYLHGVECLGQAPQSSGGHTWVESGT